MSDEARKLLLVDDHAVMREGLKELFSRERDLVVVGDARNCAEATEGCRRLRPDGVVIDISLGRENGLSLVSDLLRVDPLLKILVLSMHDEVVFAERALRAGAHGYVMTDQGASVILAALRRVLSGKTYVSEAVNERLLMTLSGTVDTKRGRTGLERLSDREIEILRLIGQGEQNRTIAALLGISTKTVETHRARIKEKLELESASELMIVAVNWLRDGFLAVKPS